MSKNSGIIVQTKNGLLGRTFNNKLALDGKVAVYLYKTIEVENDGTIDATRLSEQELQEMPILCDPETLTVLGYID